MPSRAKPTLAPSDGGRPAPGPCHRDIICHSPTRAAQERCHREGEWRSFIETAHRVLTKLCHRLLERQCPSLAAYVMVTGPRQGPPPAEGASVGYPLAPTTRRCTASSVVALSSAGIWASHVGACCSNTGRSAAPSRSRHSRP